MQKNCGSRYVTAGVINCVLLELTVLHLRAQHAWEHWWQVNQMIAHYPEVTRMKKLRIET